MPITLIFVICYIVAAVSLGTYCADYVIWAITGQDITLVADILLGLFFSSLLIPGALILWVLSLLGLMLPLIQ